MRVWRPPADRARGRARGAAASLHRGRQDAATHRLSRRQACEAVVTARNAKLNPDMRSREASMRCLLIVQAEMSKNPLALMGDMADRCMERLRLSRASAYRYVREAIDILGIPYD